MNHANILSEADVCGVVNRWVDRHKSDADAARTIGISPQALNVQRNGCKRFSPSVLAAAGLRRVVTIHYEFLENTHA